jgi:hypothetical protein
MVLKPLAFLRYILAQPSRQLGDLIARVLLCVSDVHRKFPTLFRSVFFKDIGRGPTTPAAANTARRSRIRGESFVPADVGRANRQRTRRCGASGISLRAPSGRSSAFRWERASSCRRFIVWRSRSTCTPHRRGRSVGAERRPQDGFCAADRSRLMTRPRAHTRCRNRRTPARAGGRRASR